MVVNDLREPLVVENPIDRFGLGLVDHIEVAIIVMADVLLIKPRQARGRALQRVLLAHVPVRNQIEPVGVHASSQQDYVLENSQGLRIVHAYHLIDKLHQLLRAEDLSSVQAAVDPNDGFAFGGKRARLVVSKPLGRRKPARDLFVAIELLVVLRRGNDSHEHRPAFGGLADLDELHPI